MNEINGHSNNRLPKNWKRVKLAEVCEKVEAVKRKEKNPDEDLLYLDIGGIDNYSNKIISHKNYKWCDAPSRAQQIVRKGDILFSTVRTYLKNIAIIENEIHDGQIASSGFCVIRGNEKIVTPKFAFYYTISESFLKPLNELQTGSSYPAVRDKDVFNQSFPLPPKEVQQQIVSKIEELFSELDKGIEELKTAQQGLKVYRQAVLKWAFEGKLTNRNVKDGELPEGWKWEKLGNVAKKKTIKALPADYPDAKFIGMDCIEPHTLKPSFLYDFKEFKSAGNYFKSNQVLYGRMRPYLNKVYKAEFDGACSGEFIILDCEKLFNPDLLKYILHSRGFVSFANSITTGDRPRISYEEISNYDIPFPPFEEQQQIVQEIESRLSVCDKIEETIMDSLKQAEALRQSILKKAFGGGLI